MIIKEEMYIRSLKRKRRIDIYVPDDYQSAKKRYPVLIINDGQNAFFDERALYRLQHQLQRYKALASVSSHGRRMILAILYSGKSCVGRDCFSLWGKVAS